MKKSSPAVPSSPGFPFSAIPARSFLISAMALPGFKLWNVLKKPIFTRYVKWTCNEHYIHSTTSRVLDGIFSRSPIGSRSFVKIMSHIQSKLFNRNNGHSSCLFIPSKWSWSAEHCIFLYFVQVPLTKCHELNGNWTGNVQFISNSEN